MSQNLQNFVKFQKCQLENLVDFEKCCKTHIFLQKSEPIQPKASNILPKFCQPTLSDEGPVGETAGGLEIQAPKEACFAAYADIERMPQSREKDAAAAATSGQR